MPKVINKKNIYPFDDLVPFEQTAGAPSQIGLEFSPYVEVASDKLHANGKKIIFFGSVSPANPNTLLRWIKLTRTFTGTTIIKLSAMSGYVGSAATRAGGSNISLNAPEAGEDLVIQKSTDQGATWVSVATIDHEDFRLDGSTCLGYSDFEFKISESLSVNYLLRIAQTTQSESGAFDHYVIKSLEVDTQVKKSGTTTQSSRIAQQITDNEENQSYTTKNYSLLARGLTGKSYIDNKFDDAVEIRHPSRRRKEVIEINEGYPLLISKTKLYIRGADGLSFKAFAITTDNDREWGSDGLASTDVKVNVVDYIRHYEQNNRSDLAVRLAIAEALGDAIQKESSLKLDVSVIYNQIFLKDKHVEKISTSTFKSISPPRAIHHPRIKLKVADGDQGLSSAFAELQSLRISDAQGLYKKYVLVDSNASAVTTGTVLEDGSDYGSSTLSAGHAAIGAIAVAVSLGGSVTTQNGLLVQLKAAIEGATGHAGRILVQNVPNQAHGIQTIDIISARPPLKEGMGFNYINTIGGNTQFSIDDSVDYFQKVGRPICTVTVADGDSGSSLPAEDSAVTIVTADGTSRKYVTMTASGTALESGALLNENSDVGSGTAGAAGAGGIGVARGSTQNSYLRALHDAIRHPNGHGTKIKIGLVPRSRDGNQTITLTDMTSGVYAPEVGSPVRSVTETVAVASVTFSDWSKNGVSGGKIVETISGNEAQKIKVEILNPHSLGTSLTHGINYSPDSIGKNALVGHNLRPDLISNIEPSYGSSYSTMMSLVSSGSSKPFSEDGLYAAFAGEPGENADLDRSYMVRKGESISSKSLLGPGFQADISSKECIEIDVNGSAGSSITLYPMGDGINDESRPSMAYLNASTGQWTAQVAGIKPSDKKFPGNAASGVGVSESNSNLSQQLQELAYCGFGQGTSNLFKMITTVPSVYGSFDIGSFGYTPETLKQEEGRYAFIESAHNPCINTFGFPSHPKFAASDSLSFDMSEYIDEDFLVENISIEAKITTPLGSWLKDSSTSILDTSSPLSQRASAAAYGQLKNQGCVFFLLNQRKTYIPQGLSQNAFQIEVDPEGVNNSATSVIQRNNFSIPGWYPKGSKLGWTRGTEPNSTIYTSGVDVNAGSHANSTGWSFKGYIEDQDAVSSGAHAADEAITISSNRALLRNFAFITTSKTEDTGHRYRNVTYSNQAPYHTPIPEGYDTDVYLTTSEAYRLRLFGKRYHDGSNESSTYAYMYVYATYIDQLLEGDTSGVRNLLQKVKISNTDQWYDIPVRSVFDGKNRKFNLSIVFTMDGDHANNSVSLKHMEIYRVSESSYVDSFRDVVGWGPVGTFPTNFDEVVAQNLATVATDPRDHYSLVLNTDSKLSLQKVVCTFPPRAPAYGNFGTLADDSTPENPGQDQIITNWDSIGRSGLSGIPSDRAAIAKVAPGMGRTYTSYQYSSYYPIHQPASQGEVSPYLLKKNDKLIVGVQSLTSWSYNPEGNYPDEGVVTVDPSTVKIRLYGSRIRNGRGTFSATSDNLGSNSIHETIGNTPVRDQFETEPSYTYAGTYLDNIMHGDPTLTKYLRGGQLVELGIPSSAGGEYLGYSAGTDHIGKAKDYGFGRYGNFSGFCPTFKSANAGTLPALMPTGEKFLVIDHFGVGKVYQSSTTPDEDVPTASGTATIDGITYPRVLFYRGGSGNDGYEGVQQLTLAINHAAGHGGGKEVDKHLIAIDLGFDAAVGNHWAIQILPRVNSRYDADAWDAGYYSMTIKYVPSNNSNVYWATSNEPRYEHLGGSGNYPRATGRPMQAHAMQWNWHRKTRDFNRGVIGRSSLGTAGITGSIQPFVQLKEDSIYKYDSLTIPVYEFLSLFDVYVPWTQPGHGNASGHGGANIHHNNAALAFTGSFLPIFQRCQIINHGGGLHTGHTNITAGSLSHAGGSPSENGFPKNTLNLWSRWPFERGDRRSIDVLNPTTFRCDVYGASLKPAQPISRVNVADMNRIGALKASKGVETIVSAHYTASLVGFGRAAGSRANEAATKDNLATHIWGTVPNFSSETEWEIFSPRENLDVAKKTLKALFGFETSHYMKWGSTPKTLHKLSNWHAQSLAYRTRYRQAWYGGPTYTEMEEVGDSTSRANIVVRGMRYGLDNYVPTEDKVYMRHNQYGQFRDMIEQRKFYVSCDANGSVSPDMPVEVRYVSRRVFDNLGNIESERIFGVDPATTNSQNLSLYATSSIPYIDEWESTACEKSAWQYGRDRDTAQPDVKASIINLQVV